MSPGERNWSVMFIGVLAAGLGGGCLFGTPLKAGAKIPKRPEVYVPNPLAQTLAPDSTRIVHSKNAVAGKRKLPKDSLAREATISSANAEEICFDIIYRAPSEAMQLPFDVVMQVIDGPQLAHSTLNQVAGESHDYQGLTPVGGDIQTHKEYNCGGGMGSRVRRRRHEDGE